MGEGGRVLGSIQLQGVGVWMRGYRVLGLMMG